MTHGFENEEARLAALHSYEILDSEPEKEFDLVVKNVAKIFSAPIVRLTLVDETRTWFKSKIGVSINEAPRETSICTSAIEEDKYLYIPDARKDPRFKNNSTVTGAPYIRTYLGAVIQTPTGYKIGSLCIIYPEVIEITQDQIEILVNFAQLVTQLLESRKRKIQADMLDHILNTSTTGHAIVLQDGRFKFASKSFKRITEYSYKELKELNVEALIPQGVINNNADYLLHLDHEKTQHIFGHPQEMMLQTKNGDHVPVEINISPIDYGEKKAFVINIKDIQDRKEREREIFRYENFQKLTQLPNRRMLSRQVEKLISEHKKFFVISLRFHHLSKVNKNYGSQIGSDFILHIADLLRSFESDACFVAHINSLDFVFILQTERNYDVELLMSKIFNKAKEGKKLENRDLPISYNGGVAIYPKDGEDADSLINNASAAMSRSIKKGAKTYAYHVDTLAFHSDRQDEIEYFLQHALDKDELELFYQPKVDSQHNRFVGAEALIRWNSEELGFVLPTEFIPIAEHSGLILPIGGWIIEQGCKQARKLLDCGYKDFAIALNVSPRQVTQDIILEKLETALNQYNLDGRYIELEVTEGLFLEGSSTVEVQLEAMKVINASLALDDFGTGYSSISYLRDYPFDTLKIDQSFVRTLDINDTNKTSLVNAIVSMGRSLDMKIVAEGVETAEQAEFLRERGCHILQGYHFARPMPEKEFMEWLKDHFQL